MSETAGLVAQLPETRNLRIDARTFNLRVHGDGLSQKPTGIRTGRSGIPRALGGHICLGGHKRESRCTLQKFARVAARAALETWERGEAACADL
eukprot:6688156-Pyramimonas_sp.AAC.1